LNFIIRVKNVVTGTLAILAALDLNPVANLGLRKFSTWFIYTTTAWNSSSALTFRDLSLDLSLTDFWSLMCEWYWVWLSPLRLSLW